MPWKDGTPDVVPPVISGVTAGGILATEATILWHSDEPANERVEYGLTSALGSAAQGSGSLFEHAVRISGLRPSTTYYYRAVSADAAGNTSRSARATFTTGVEGPVEVIVDDGGDGFSTGGPWAAGGSPGGFGGDYLFSSSHAQETGWARFQPYLPRAGLYEVAVWYVAGSNRVVDARHTVVHADGNSSFPVNQQSGGSRWQVLGNFRFGEGTDGHVRLSNQASGGSVVVADGVRFRLLEAEEMFLRGDANADGAIEIADAVRILRYLFADLPPPACLDLLDADDSGGVAIADTIFLLNHLFTGGRAPPPPYPTPGPDPTADALDC
jgi:hypothetical protein